MEQPLLSNLVSLIQWSFIDIVSFGAPCSPVRVLETFKNWVTQTGWFVSRLHLLNSRAQDWIQICEFLIPWWRTWAQEKHSGNKTEQVKIYKISYQLMKHDQLMCSEQEVQCTVRHSTCTPWFVVRLRGGRWGFCRFYRDGWTRSTFTALRLCSFSHRRLS